MDKKKLVSFIFYALIIFVVAGMITIIFLLKSEGTQCLKNPFVYGASGVVGHGDQNLISCSCFVGHEGGISSNFCFDDQELKTEGGCFINVEDNEIKSWEVTKNISS